MHGVLVDTACAYKGGLINVIMMCACEGGVEAVTLRKAADVSPMHIPLLQNFK